MQPLEVQLFGGLHLRRGDEHVPPIPSRAARVLFAYLVLHRGVQHPREQLAARFWPGSPDSKARRRLSHTLWQLQDALSELPGDADYLDVRSGTIGFGTEVPATVDVEEFTHRFESLRERRAAGRQRARDLSELEGIVELYRGDFLAGHYDDWVTQEQERLEQLYLEALTSLVGLAKGQGAYDDALTYARRLTNLDPLREDGHREVMRLTMLLGRPADAIRQFERCQDVLAEELGTAPAAATTQLYERIVRQRSVHAEADALEAGPRFPERLPLLGREQERRAALQVLERALAGRGGAILVEGDAGLGKTRLLDEVADDARWRGFTVLAADCSGAESPLPFGAIQDVLDTALTPLRVEQLRHRVSPIWLAEAARIAPILARPLAEGALPGAGLSEEESAQRMRDALTAVLLALGANDAVALVVDDLQWADNGTLAVLEELAERLSEDRIVLMVGYRSEEARQRPRVWERIRALDERAQPTRLVLEPLDAFSTGELTRLVASGHGIDPRAIARLQRETGGNPLFLVETLRELAAGGRLPALGDREADDLPLPSSIRELVHRRLERLGQEARTVLDVAAVDGHGSELAVLLAATDLPQAVVVDAVDTLLRDRLLTESGDGYAFHHEQIRRTVIDALPRARRVAVHLRLGQAIESEAPDDVARLAHHFTAGEAPRRAIPYLVAAARNAAAVHAYADAAEHYERATELQQGVPASTDARFELLAAYADVLDVLGDRSAESRVLDTLTTLASGRPRQEVEAARRRAMLLAHRGDLPAAVQLARSAVAQATELGDPELLAGVLVVLGTALTWAGDGEEAATALLRAADATRSRTVRAEVRCHLGTVLRELQRYDEAAAELDQALALARPDGDLRIEAQALGVLGAVRMETGDVRSAAALYQQAIDRCQAIGHRSGEGRNQLNLANVDYLRGEIGAALGGYATAARLFTELGDRRGMALVRLNLAQVRHAVLGDDRGARDDAEAALSYATEVGADLTLALAHDTLASTALRTGDHRAAEQHVTAGLRTAERAESGWARVHLVQRRAELALLHGDPAAAIDHVLAGLALIEQHGLADLAPPLLVVQIDAHLAAGDTARAAEVASRAVQSLHDGVERPYLVQEAQARARWAVGDVAGATAAHADAQRRLEGLLATVPPEHLDGARAEPEHAAILAESLEGMAVITVASAGVPTGRSLTADEQLEVAVPVIALPGDPDDPVERRRAVLQRIVDHLVAAGGAATVGDLAAALEVSEATVRRDLRALREAGRSVPTRGHRAG